MKQQIAGKVPRVFGAKYKRLFMDFQLTSEEKKFLLDLARRSIYNYLHDQPGPKDAFYSANLETACGAFVTIHIKSELRGCIGYVKGYKALQRAVSDLAVSAAFNDPRFPPLSAQEFDEIDIEISVLSPLKKVEDISEIVIGRDGLLISRGYFEGLLLPQVATEYNWGVETFLQQTCLKAHLPPEAWKEDEATIFRFSAIIFSERHQTGSSHE